MRPLYQRTKPLITSFLWVASLVGAIIALDRWDKKLTDGFSHEAILGPFPPYEKDNLTQLTAQERADIDILFSQPFRYFAKGAQCFALESYDGRYVLKCFKQKHLYKTPMLHFLEHFSFLDDYVAKRLERRRKRAECMITGCHVAYNHLREETGILYLHFAQTDHLPPFKIIDYRGKMKEFDSNDISFYLQKKGIVLREGFLSFRKNNDLEGAKQALQALFDYLMACDRCTVLDADPGYVHNLGWIDGKGTNLDIGKIVKLDDLDYVRAKRHEHLVILRTFFEQEYPEMLSAYDEGLIAFEQALKPL